MACRCEKGHSSERPVETNYLAWNLLDQALGRFRHVGRLDGPQCLSQGETGPRDRTVPLRKVQRLGAQPVPNPVKQLFGRPATVRRPAETRRPRVKDQFESACRQMDSASQPV
jgi:hypothetical protein